MSAPGQGRAPARGRSGLAGGRSLRIAAGSAPETTTKQPPSPGGFDLVVVGAAPAPAIGPKGATPGCADRESFGQLAGAGVRAAALRSMSMIVRRCCMGEADASSPSPQIAFRAREPRAGPRGPVEPNLETEVRPMPGTGIRCVNLTSPNLSVLNREYFWSAHATFSGQIDPQKRSDGLGEVRRAQEFPA